MDCILLTSAGGLVGTYLIKHLKATRDCRIVAADTSKLTPAAENADVFYLVPRVSEDGFLQRINEIIRSEGCNVVIPVASHDVSFFSGHMDDLPDGMRLMIIERELNDVLSDKQRCYAYLKSLEIQTPRMIEPEHPVFPCIIKPKCSSGTKNTVILHNRKDLDYYCSCMEDYMVCEFLRGDEFTVDCLFDWDGHAVGYNIRKREKTVSGGAVISVNVREESVDAVIRKLEGTGKIRGPVNFQYKLNADGQPVVFDFNTRLPSGGLPLTVRSGFDIPNLLIDLLLGKSVGTWKRDASADGLTMIRYYEEMFLKT